MRTIIHADLDAFFASVEQLDNPLFRNRPVIVGGDPRGRGVVCAASYEARKFGVKSAMPTSMAYKICPQGIYLQPRFARYQQISYKFKAILNSLTPRVEPLSLDEAFLDVSVNSLKLSSPKDLAIYIQKRVKKELGLDVSLGVAPNKLLAKLASELDKPQGLVIIEAENVAEFLDPQPIENLWGVGKKTAKKLHDKNIYQVADIKKHKAWEFSELLGSFGPNLFEMAHGIDHREVSPKGARKSLGVERTFSKDIKEPKELERYLFSLCLEASKRAKQKKIWAKSLTLKYKNNLFESRSVSKSFETEIQTEDEIFLQTRKLLQKIPLDPPLRLLGVSLGKFSYSAKRQQLELFN